MQGFGRDQRLPNGLNGGGAGHDGRVALLELAQGDVHELDALGLMVGAQRFVV